MEKIIIDALGWVRSLLLLLAYWLLSQNKVSPASFQYQMTNIIGSILLLIHTFFYGAYPSSALNLVWAGIGLLSLLKNNRTHLRHKTK